MDVCCKASTSADNGHSDKIPYDGGINNASKTIGYDATISDYRHLLFFYI